jgi:response regulator RpfG family c-di-GMP phosphodiesterase
LDSGQHFAPDVVDVFFENMDEILKIKAEVDTAEDV